MYSIFHRIATRNVRSVVCGATAFEGNSFERNSTGETSLSYSPLRLQEAINSPRDSVSTVPESVADSFDEYSSNDVSLHVQDSINSAGYSFETPTGHSSAASSFDLDNDSNSISTTDASRTHCEINANSNAFYEDTGVVSASPNETLRHPTIDSADLLRIKRQLF